MSQGVAAFVALSVFGALVYGLADVIKHGCVRLLLWVSGRAPLDLVAFLEDATARALLRRVGGGYLFIHRRMVDYFAALPDEGGLRSDLAWVPPSAAKSP